MIALLRIARAGIAWVIRNPQIALLGLVVAVLAYMRIEVGWLRSRLDRAKAKAEGLQQEVKAHELRNEVENSIAADRGDPRERLRSDWSE